MVNRDWTLEKFRLRWIYPDIEMAFTEFFYRSLSALFWSSCYQPLIVKGGAAYSSSLLTRGLSYLSGSKTSLCIWKKDSSISWSSIFFAVWWSSVLVEVSFLWSMDISEGNQGYGDLRTSQVLLGALEKNGLSLPISTALFSNIL